jgi:nitrite reductase (NADH) small subunit
MSLQLEQINGRPSRVEKSAVRVCAVEELPLGLGRAFEIHGKIIALFRTRGGQIFAVDNRCPHKNGPLAEGMLAGNSVVCPLHSFRYDMASGECDQPGACAVTAYPVDVRDGDVFLATEPS